MGMQPLRLEWTLSTPMVVGAHPLHLDALVAYAVTEEALRTGMVVSGPISDIARDLPLQREEQAGQWCWKASALRRAAGPHSTRFWTRKTDPYDYATRAQTGQLEGRFKAPMKPYAAKIDTQRGLLKQQFKFFPVQQIQTVTAWCIGDLNRLEELLHPDSGFVTNLGGKGRMGFGKVRSFLIESDDAALMKWAERVLPWAHEGALPVRLAIRPPYWDVANLADAFAIPALLG
ncbi:type IV CRISPR-associated protein Csf3 [Duganella vulcania]|uniref:Type IV CRISPR-associated protein Csf3 n=1 Tax=Duganella vulcania TaxID=2692166 RepID=A0A845GGT9_9BURK|nr:type IV CRISPR-associated protein Csf3 [Duganella vulcania]MYM92615.1 type IV CRISPR-associated protein Csf3 [Duganella vulcania]